MTGRSRGVPRHHGERVRQALELEPERARAVADVAREHDERRTMASALVRDPEFTDPCDARAHRTYHLPRRLPMVRFDLRLAQLPEAVLLDDETVISHRPEIATSTSIRSPPTSVPVSVHSETPRDPVAKWVPSP
jgi:hypothetical protein